MRRFDVYLVSLDPVRGKEIKKTRPAVIVSPDEMNQHIGIVIVAPMTTRSRKHPSRANITFNRKKGQIVLDQLRAVDKRRLLKRLGKVSRRNADRVLVVLRDMFAR
jgi:mRNA interferase MazF